MGGLVGTLGLLGAGTGTASADPREAVGTASDPLQTVYAQELNGGVTGGTGLTTLAGTALSVDGSGALTATDARLDVTDGSTSVENVEAITFGAGLSVADDDDGTVTIDR